MTAADIRLDMRPGSWLVTVTVEGWAETFTASYPDTVRGAAEAASHGILAAVRRSPDSRPSITARGVGARFVKDAATIQGLECEMRQAHPNRGRSKPNP